MALAQSLEEQRDTKHKTFTVSWWDALRTQHGGFLLSTSQDPRPGTSFFCVLFCLYLRPGTPAGWNYILTINSLYETSHLRVDDYRKAKVVGQGRLDTGLNSRGAVMKVGMRDLSKFLSLSPHALTQPPYMYTQTHTDVHDHMYARTHRQGIIVCIQRIIQLLVIHSA